MKNSPIIFLFVLILGLLSCQAQSDNNNQEGEGTTVAVTSRLLSPVSFDAKIKEIGTAQLIDVRTPEEHQASTIPGSQNINVLERDFAEKVKNLDKNQPVMVYCRRGGRSGKAADILEAMGFTEIYDLHGGMSAWEGKKLPTEIPAN
jgi:rhodanese-related sulfurtransferase